MLDSTELKTVLTTLSQRRTWLLKHLEEQNRTDGAEEEHQMTVSVLDSAMQKLSKMVTSKVASPVPPPSPRRKSGKKPSIDPEDAHVLIAEDNPNSAALLRGVLEQMGVENIEMVEDGRAALYALQNCSPPYDLVLCDWDMPEMTGLEVRIAVKNLEKLRDTHFVMVSTISDAARIKEAISHGINDYVVKPVDVEILERKLQAALAGTTALDATKS